MKTESISCKKVLFSISALGDFPILAMLSDILRQRTRDIEVKRYCVSLLEKFGSFAYTRDILASLDEEARNEVRSLGGNPHMEAVLDELLLTWKSK